MTVELLREQPLFFPAGEETLFGILTEAPVHASVGAVVLNGGGYMISPGRNRVLARLGSRLAAGGLPALRFDYHGVGESTGSVERFRLDRPFVADLEGALACLEGLGLRRAVVIGTCFGSRTALSGSHLAGIAAMALLSPPLFDDPAVPVAAPLFVTHLAELVARRLPVLIAYGTEDDFLPMFEAARTTTLAPIIESAGELMDVVIVPGRLHGFLDLALQDAAIDLLADWAARAARRVVRPA